MNPKAEKIIKTLSLEKHPEGGYFKEIFRSDEFLNKDLPKRYQGMHTMYTSIYFLLSENDFSAFHVLKSDEIWHFYDGTTLDLHIINIDGVLKTISLGKEIEKGENYIFLIKAGEYFAAEVKDKKSYSLVGCTVSPGFEYEDFELCKRESLTKKFPQHNDIINRLTR